MKKKILLITTGGTLACTHTESGLAPTLKGADILAYANKGEEEIHILDFKLIDSSIMTDDDRADLAKIIWDNSDYQAFIITHGTDSMAYTAAYLDCVLHNFGKTVVITGAQLPLQEVGTDAIDNLNLALKTAAGGYFGVCLAIYGRIIPAKVATKMETEGFAAFESVNKKYLTQPIEIPKGKEELLCPKKKVGLIYITPSLAAQTILQYKDCQVLLVLVLGAGGVLRHQEAALDRLKADGMEIYIKSQCVFGRVEAIYQAHSGVEKYHIINDTSIEYALCKLSL
ncbi:MAG: asparaginase domain-containing protein [Oscillospiraceae bacterium]